MYVRISSTGSELVDAEEFTAFSVSTDLDGPDLAEAVRRDEIGEVLPDGEHVMVAVAALRRLAGDRGAEWEAGLAGMVGYAESKGWTGEDGGTVRAHVER